MKKEDHVQENINAQEISDFLNESHGKFIRSQVIYLYGSNLGIRKERLIELAAASELIHLSTLIHDDIIDEADLRRNKPTVVKKWGLKKAILYGDYLYTKTFKTLKCKGWGRVDLILDEKEQKPWIIEINTVPGMTEHSLLPMAAKEKCIDFDSLVLKILDTSYE